MALFPKILFKLSTLAYDHAQFGLGKKYTCFFISPESRFSDIELHVLIVQHVFFFLAKFEGEMPPLNATLIVPL